jgi:rRNA small subunit pseudouridine methyltransferase Nep1
MEGKPAKIPRTSKENDSAKRLIVILENASLETVKCGKKFELLNCDDHKSILKKHGRDLSSARPDIAHQVCQSTYLIYLIMRNTLQCLLMLLDSPLNRAGLLQVYIHTERNVLIEVNPQTRIPRTFPRFCGLMVQLLHKLSIHASDGPMKLLRVIKNPITIHLPAGCRKIGTSFNADKCVKVKDYAPDNQPIVFVVGAMAHGRVSVDYTEKDIAISEYPLSAALTCAKLCCAFEEAWSVQ